MLPLQPTVHPPHLEDAEKMVQSMLNCGDVKIQNEMIAHILRRIIDERAAMLRKVEKDYYLQKEALKELGDIKQHLGNDAFEDMQSPVK